jgi:hypothetical protein
LASDKAVLEASGALATGQTGYQLAALELADNALDDAIVKELAQLYVFCRSFLCVHARHTLLQHSLTHTHYSRVCRRCKRNDRIGALSLAGNGISDSGAAALLKALVGNTSLAVLDLSRNPIRFDDALRAALAQLYATNRTLRTIDFAR